MYGKSVIRTFLDPSFWEPIPFKWYQNTSGSGTVVQSIISSVVKGISGRGVRRAGKRYMNKKF